MKTFEISIEKLETRNLLAFDCCNLGDVETLEEFDLIFDNIQASDQSSLKQFLNDWNIDHEIVKSGLEASADLLETSGAPLGSFLSVFSFLNKNKLTATAVISASTLAKITAIMSTYIRTVAKDLQKIDPTPQ